MKRKLPALFIVLCLAVAMLPGTAKALPSTVLYVGDTWVSDSSDYEIDTIYYWIENPDSTGPAYVREGDAANYAFSAQYLGGGAYRLTLNGVAVTTAHGDPLCGIGCGGALELVLAEGSENSIDLGQWDVSVGVYAEGGLNVQGSGELTVLADGAGLWSKSGGLRIDGSLEMAITSQKETGIRVGSGGISIGDGANLTITTEKYGIDCGALLQIAGDTVTVTGKNRAFLLGMGSAGLVLPDAYRYKYSDTASEPEGAYSYSPPNAYVYDQGHEYLSFRAIYGILLNASANGGITAEVNGTAGSSALSGDTVTLNAAPANGYGFSSWSVYKTDEPNTAVPVSGNIFVMPAYGVTVEAVFALIPTPSPTSVPGRTERPERGPMPTPAPTLTPVPAAEVPSTGENDAGLAVWLLCTAAVCIAAVVFGKKLA